MARFDLTDFEWSVIQPGGHSGSLRPAYYLRKPLQPSEPRDVVGIQVRIQRLDKLKVGLPHKRLIEQPADDHGGCGGTSCGS